LQRPHQHRQHDGKQNCCLPHKGHLAQRTRRVDRTSFASRHFVVNGVIPSF
jgi:hypothetical protein